MDGDVKLSELESVLSAFSYPVTRAEVVEQSADVTLRYADGEEPMADVVRRSSIEEFGSVEDLQTEIFNLLPTRAVGEPGQSEGEG